MSKISVKSVLKNQNDIYIFEGKGIKNKEKINYNDNGVLTIITLGDTVWIERKKDFFLKLGFKLNQKIKGTYIISEGKIIAETFTNELIINENEIIIDYSLTLNNENIQNFTLNFQYTIDS